MTLPPGGAPPGRWGSARPDYLAEDGRDLRIDLIRGFLVLAMVVDHLRGESPLFLLTGGNRFFASAAEGFILISGLMTGLVYRRVIQREGMTAGLWKILSRAASLYVLTVTVTLLFTAFSELAGLPWATGVDLSDPVRFVVSVLALRQTYYLIDTILLYTLLFLCAPIAFVLLERGKAKWVLAGSATMYATYQFFPDLLALPWPIDGNNLFTFSAWQVLFFGGLVLGYHQSRVPTLGPRATRLGLAAAAAGMALFVGLYALLELGPGALQSVASPAEAALRSAQDWLDEYAFAKADLRPGRLLASAVAMAFLFLLATRFWRAIARVAGKLLLPLGQSALYAFIAHIVVAGAYALIFPSAGAPDAATAWLNAALQALGVAIVWVAVTRKIVNPTPATLRYWRASPVLAGGAVVLALGQGTLGLTLPAPAPAPVESVDRIARRYGTPVPRAPRLAAVAVATPTPVMTSTYVSVNPDTGELASDYLLPLDGRALEGTLYSPALGRDMPYYVYLPPGYEQSTRRYPVLYMLHGLGGHREEWIAYGLFNVLDRQISIGGLQPYIVVLPQGDKGYWIDNADGGPRWGEYVARDLVKHVDAAYRTLPSTGSRAIGGLSMGGYAALVHGLSRPDAFGVVGAHSPSLRPDDGAVPLLGREEDFDARDPVFLAAHVPGLGAQRIWVDIGEDDVEWLPRAKTLNDALSARGVEHTFKVLPGGHDYDYWRGNLLSYVRFYGSAFESR